MSLTFTLYLPHESFFYCQCFISFLCLDMFYGYFRECAIWLGVKVKYVLWRKLGPAWSRSWAWAREGAVSLIAEVRERERRLIVRDRGSDHGVWYEGQTRAAKACRKSNHSYNRKPYEIVCPFEYHPIPNRTIAWGASSSLLYLDFDRQAPIQITDNVFTI